MKSRKITFALATVLLVSAAAMASPIFGTWKGDLNGRPITVAVTYTNGHAEVNMTSDARAVAVSDAAFPKGAPPLQLRFQAANQSGKFKLASTAGDNLTFDLQTQDGRTAVLRVMDEGKTIQTVTMTKEAK